MTRLWSGLWLVACAGLVLGLDAALASDWPVHVDAVNLGLGAWRGFSPLHYQPHPPGYLGYVLFLDALEWLGLGQEGAVALARWGARLSAAAVPVAAGLLAAQVWGSVRALRIAALLAATSPLLLVYAMDGQSYPAEALGLAAGLGAALHLRRHPSVGAALLLGLVAGGLGALRPTVTALLAVPSLVALWRQPARLWALALGAGAVALAAWAVPTVVASGGLATWRALSAALVGETIAGAFSPLVSGAAPRALVQNLVILGVGLASVALPFALALAGRPWAGRGRPGFAGLGPLALALVLPSLLLYLLLFCAEPGYLLGQLPLWAALGAGPLAGAPRQSRALAVAGLAALIQLALFLGLPAALVDPSAGVQLSSLPSAASISTRQRQAAAWTAAVTLGLPPDNRQLVVSDAPAETWTKNLPLASPSSDALVVHFAGSFVTFRHDTLVHYGQGPQRWAPGAVPLAEGPHTRLAVPERYDWIRVDPVASEALRAALLAQARCLEATGDAALLPARCFPERRLRLGEKLTFVWATPSDPR